MHLFHLFSARFHQTFPKRIVPGTIAQFMALEFLELVFFRRKIVQSNIPKFHF